MNTATEFLRAVCDTSIQASLLIVLILLLRPILGARVPAAWRAALWALVLVRLLVPGFLLPPSPASLQNVPVVQRPVQQAEIAVDRVYTGYFPADGLTPGMGPVEPVEAAMPLSEPARATLVIPWWTAAFILWVAGATLLALWILVGLVRLYRELRREDEAVEPSEHEIWRRCCEEAGRGSRIRLRATRLIDSPALVGLWRPTLLVPVFLRGKFSEADWRHVFLHELGHYARGDHWMQALMLAASCLHWFNPLVWVGFRFLRTDRELAADEWALRRLESEASFDYGQTLLKVLTASQAGAFRFAGVGVMEDASQMKTRILRISAFGSPTVVGTALGLAVLAILAAVALGRQINARQPSDYADLPMKEVLVAAARAGDLSTLERKLPRSSDADKQAALTAAASAGQIDAVRSLVTRGVAINESGVATAPALKSALMNGQTDVADYLLAKGAVCDPSFRAAATGDEAALGQFITGSKANFETLRPLCEIAAACGHLDAFIQLDDAIRKLVSSSDWRYSTGLAARVMARGHKDVLGEMISRGVDLEVGNGVARYSEAVAKAPGMREWLASRDLKIPEISDNERLIGAAERGDIPEMRRLLREGANVNFYGENGWTPLTKAATWGQPKAVKLLLEHHADPNIPKSYDYSALCLAKTAEIAEMLFNAGAASNAKKAEDHIVWYAMQQGNDGVVKWFMDHGVDLAKVDSSNKGTALFLAGSPQIAEWLIERGVDVNATNEFGETSLVQALKYKNRGLEIAKVLLKHGADPNAKDEYGRTPLMIARDGETVELLVAAGADLTVKDKSGVGVAASVIHDVKPSRYEALARHGVRIGAQTDAPVLASHAILDGNQERVKMLLGQGLDPNARVKWGERLGSSLVAMAISFGRWSIVDLLREAGATDVGPLSEAAARGDLQKMSLSLAAGSEIDERDRSGSTPLFYAVRRANVDAVKFLLDHGANMNAFTVYGGNVHSLAEMLRQSSTQKVEMYNDARAKAESAALTEIQALLNAGRPDPNARNENGETVLHLSAATGGIECGLLISQGADVNARNKDGMTPLMLAIVNQVPDAKKIVTIRDPKAAKEQMYSASGYVVRQLLDKGADRNLKNAAGQTAMDLARQKGDAEILALMEAKP